MDVFPSKSRAAHFLVYDDDGHSNDYEDGQYFRQKVVAQETGTSTEIALGSVTGTYQAHFPHYVLRVQQAAAAVTGDGKALRRFASEDGFSASSDPGWFSTSDRFGALT